MELRDHFIAAHNEKPSCSTKSFVSTVRKIQHHDDVSAGKFVDVLIDKDPREWTKQASSTSEDATAACMVVVIAKSDM